MKNIILITAAVILMAGCKNTRNTADAYGNFEATEVTVSAETGGRILSIPVSEGMKIRRGEIIAVVDTTLLNLQKGEIDAGIAGTLTRISSINAQNGILVQQIENLMVNIRRIENMLK
ncbi:MAG: biotin/lipoyl-binding protein, partial [Bacteroidales bacterium]|nr:biotin/lipoyl-binding protein [Bacteroidales bacterium]